MNKLIVCCFVLTAYMLTACESGLQQGGDLELKTRQDSLSYAYGVSSINGGGQSMKALGITLNIPKYKEGAAFAAEAGKDFDQELLSPLRALGQELQTRQGKPFTAEDKPATDIDAFSYAYGLYNASTYVSCDYKVNIDATCAGMADAYADKAKFGEEEVSQLARAFNMELSEALSAESAKEFLPNKLEGETWLEENKAKPGVIVTESGLQYKVLRNGSGTVSPTATQTVKVHYAGRLMDGTEFDSSIGGDPIEYPVNGFVPGWIEALQLMQVGDKFELYVPQELAYGGRQQGPTIKPYSMLIFEMELLDIVK